jgi:tetratricopeptide (TPR) repeat protein
MCAIKSNRLVVLLLCVVAARAARASDLGTPPKLQTALIPRKTTSPQERRSAVLQGAPDFALWDATQKIVPSSAGHVYLVEINNGAKLLVRDLSDGVRGWVATKAVVPLSAAEAFFTQQLTSNPSNVFAYLMRGVARCENDDLERAAADLDEALRHDSKYVPALIARAYLWQWRGKLDAAVADATAAIEIEPQNSFAYLERAVFHCNRKEFDKCLRDLDAAERLGSRLAVIHVCRGMIAVERAEWQKARDELTRALQIDPRHPDAQCGMASIYLSRGDNKRALEVLDQAIAIEPKSPDAHGNRALVYLTLGKYDKALDDLDDVLKVAPGSARALRERAWILATCPDAKVRNGELAVAAATRACEATGGKDSRCVATLAAAYAESGDFDSALKYQQKAIELLDAKSTDAREYKRLLLRYHGKKPYRHLPLLQEMGVAAVPVPKKNE